MTYDEWEAGVPDYIRSDLLWKMQAYRLALFVGDLGWYDVTKLAADSRTASIAGQLYRSLGSVTANLAEGYGRSSGKDRARIHEIALGEARESREWYWRGRFVLGDEVIEHRCELIVQIIKLLTTTIKNERGVMFREDEAPYDTGSSTNNQ